MSKSTWVKVDAFSVRTRTETNPVYIYDNENMQVEVIVDIKVVDINGYPVKLSQFDIDQIKLTDYTNADRFNRGWSYSRVENKFAHTLPESVSATSSAIVSDTQSFSFWVCCSEEASVISIGASILTPQDILITTHSPLFDSHVSLAKKDGLKYDLTNINFTRVNTSDSPVFSDGIRMDQDNYYLSLKDNYAVTSVDWMNSTLPVFSRLNNEEFYAWLLEANTTQTITYQSVTQVDNYDITINDIPGNVTFTRMVYINGQNWSAEFTNPVNFTVFDLYGNSGAFIVAPQADKNTLSIAAYVA